MDEFLTPLKTASSEFTEKKSTFRSDIFLVTTEEEAKAHLEMIRKRYHDARHHCWCFRLKNGVERYSDDGEPQGTAGQPMLNVFQRERVTNVLCVVTRYFGGILLGAGGLTRAYARGAKDALDAAGIAVNRLWSRVELTCPYPLFERLKLLIAAKGGKVSGTAYTADVQVTAMFPAEEVEGFQLALRELSSGSVGCGVTGQDFFPSARA